MSQQKLPYYAAPAGLRERVQAAVRHARRRQRPRAALWMTGVAAAVVVFVAGAFVADQRSGADTEVSAVLDAHLRSLAPGRLADVASTDQHTVKPWFAGKLDFSPPVVDFAADGFPLTGGRLDVVQSRPVAALIYARRNHIINVFIRPSDADERSAAASVERRGYNVVAWTDRGMRHWAVSDLNVGELTQLKDLMEARR